MSLLEWSPSTNSIVTVSIHYYEKDDFKKEFLTNPYNPEIHIDPQQRCAILHFYGDKIAVLPFRQEEIVGVGGTGVGVVSAEEEMASKLPYSPSFVLDVSSIDTRIKNVIDMAFLFDYYEPTLAILFEPVQSWTSRPIEHRDTVSLVVISLDLTSKINPVIYSLDRLPQDSTRLVAIPKPVGGMLVFSANSIVHVAQGSPGVGVALNIYAERSTQLSLDFAPAHLALALEGAQPVLLADETVLCVLRDGTWLLIEMVLDGRTVVGLRAEVALKPPEAILPTKLEEGDYDDAVYRRQKIGVEHVPRDVVVMPSCAAVVKEGEYFFLGSRAGDSVLVKWAWKDAGVKEEVKVKGETDMPGAEASRRNAVDVDMDLYGSDVPNGNAHMTNGHGGHHRRESGETSTFSSQFLHAVCDTLLNTGPIVDMAAGEVAIEEEDLDLLIDEEDRREEDRPLELVTCSGQGKNGSLSVYQRNIHPHVSFKFSASGCRNIWSVKCRKDFDGVDLAGGRVKNQANGTAGGVVAPPAADGSSTVEADGTSDADMLDKYLFIAKDSGTMVLAAGEELQELENTDFYTDGQTVAVGTFLKQTRIVQVYADGFRLLNANGKMKHMFPIGDGTSDVIVAATIADPYLLLFFEDGTIKVMQGDAKTKGVTLVQLPATVNETPIISCCIYSDETDLFSAAKDVEVPLPARSASFPKSTRKRRSNTANRRPAKRSQPSQSAMVVDELDDVDLDLYGDSHKDDEMDEDEDGQRKFEAKPIKIEQLKVEDRLDREGSSDIGYSDADNEDEDKDIYGSGSAQTKTKFEEDVKMEVNEANVSLGGKAVGGEERKSATYWCVVYRLDSSLEIYKLPEFEEVFFFPRFDLSPALLVDNAVRQPTAGATSSGVTGAPTLAAVQSDTVIMEIEEIVMTSIGKQKKEPYLVARTHANDVIIYKAFRFMPGSEPLAPGTEPSKDVDHSNRLALRFSRVYHDHVWRETAEAETATDVKGKEVTTNLSTLASTAPTNSGSNALKHKRRRPVKRLIPFSDIAGYTGLFVTGSRPSWLICSSKSFARVHPMKVKDDVVAFTQFHNVNCRHGFLIADSKSTLRIARLPTDNITYDLDWPVRKIPMGCSVHKIQYHPTMQVYAVLVATPEPFLIRDENGIPIDGEERDPNALLPEVERFSMVLVSPVTWEIVDRYIFDEAEQGLALECVSLESKQTATGRKSFMAIGTGFNRGEDTAMRGRIYIFDIIEVVPEPDNPQTNHKFKLLHQEDVKGAVTALCAVNGYLVTCVGPKVIIRSFEDNESLVGVAFIDVQIYVTSVAAIKNVILLGDAYKSVWFLGFQEEPAKLALLGKDYHSLEVSCTNFIIDDKSLYFLIGDAEENVELYQYAPFNLQSFSGQKLMRRGDFHVGSQVKAMVRMARRPKKNEPVAEALKKQFCFCATLDGSIGMITPIPEKMFKRLQLLYGQLVNGLQHPAGLNPRAFRILQSSRERMASNRTKAILDGDLILQFPNLALNRQKEMTKQIGTTVERIMEDLVEVAAAADHF
ncbi:hypothetical protein BC937DRAFT_87899 [Endogone sp. FLAS-F59071]|nr:hypothetical protein BC937DRAFT_87899 [Endogone sp. FLAS-F59071]|eukprot:RUS19169.1 hypothetical protein BC937DRAFT_87899 [Endogone sp. FLAS-F59071]